MAATVGTQQIPDGWRHVRLGDVAEVAFSGVDKRTVDGEVPVQLCNYTDVFYNRRIVVGMGLMSATATPSEKEKWTLRKGDVLFTKDSETPEEIGIPAFVTDDMPGVLCGYHLGLARPIESKVDGAFLAEALTSLESRKQFARIANGVTRFGLTLDATKALPILLPPLPEQRAIATVLDSIDDAIEGAEAVIATTETLRDSLLHDLLTRGLPGQHTEFRDVPGLGTIPADWGVARLGDVAEVRNGTTPSRRKSEYWGGEGIPFVKTGQVNDIYIVEPEEFITPLAMQDAGPVIVPEGAVLIAMIGQGKTRGMAAKLGFSAAINQNFAAVYEPRPGFDLGYFFAWASQNYAFIRALGQGSNQDALNCEVIQGMKFPLPSIAEQHAIAAALNRVDGTIEIAQAEAAGLRLLKEFTADALLTGRVRAFTVLGIPNRESIDVQRT